MLTEFIWQPSDVLEVTSLSTDGRGICRHCGWTVFVAGALPGENITLSKVQKKGSFWEGTLNEVHVKSEQRQKPPCPVFGTCGGCQLQHLNEGAEAESKLDFLKHNLRRLGNWTQEQLEELRFKLHAAQPWAYRQRAKILSNKVTFGFRKGSSHEIVAVENCPLLVNQINQALTEQKALHIDGEIEFTKDNRGKVHSRKIEKRRGFEERISKTSQKSAFVTLDHPRVPQFKTPLNGFVQPHKDAVYLYHKCIEGFLTPWIGLNADKFPNTTTIECWDLYCGSGALSFSPLFALLANDSKWERVIIRAIEGIAPSIEAAEQNFESVKTTIHQKTVIDFKARAIAVHAFLAGFSGAAPQICLMDPPRSGIDEGTKKALKRIYSKTSGPKVVCYVACDSASLSRDSRHLVDECGFKLIEAHVFNTFAQTVHFETIAFFVKD